MINGAELAFAAWGAAEETARQQAVVMARRFYDGVQDVKLSSELKAFLGDDQPFSVNFCRVVVDSVTERLLATGIGATEDEAAAWAAGVWEENELGLRQAEVHESSLVDGEAFVIVGWDGQAGRVTLTQNPRYTDATVGGDNFGCKAHYPNGDMTQAMMCASKRWVERLENGRARQRCNLYWPDRVEKYEVIGGQLIRFEEAGDGGWPVAWVGRDGAPLGIPVVHMTPTPDLRSELWDAIPVQRGINKGVVDLLASADVTALRIFVAFGWIPTTDGKPLAADGGNLARIKPGTILGTTRPADEVEFRAIDGMDVRPLIEMVQSQIGWLAVTTNTPESRLSFTRQIAAEGTLQEQKESLYAKVRKRQAMLDAGWRRVFETARRVHEAFGGPVGEGEFVVQWAPVQSRDTADERDEWRVKRELGVPLETIWAEMGYSAEEIAAMKRTEEYRARVAAMRAGLGGDEG